MSGRRTPLLIAMTVSAVAGLGAAAAGPAAAVIPRAPATSPVAAKPVASAAGVELVRERSVIYTRNGSFGPYGPDPATSMVPDDGRVDWGGWRRVQAARGKAATKARDARQATAGRAAATAPKARIVREDEPAGTRGSNDTFASAQAIPGFGTQKGRYPAYTVLGRQSPAPVPALEAVAPSAEPDDEPENARDTGVRAQRDGIRTTGTIGDNIPDPADPGLTDTDLYKVTLRSGDLLRADVKRTSGDLLPLLVLLDATGNLVAWGEEDFESAAWLTTGIRTAGTYYVLVAGWTVIDLDTGTTTDTKGGYDFSLSARTGDRDLFKVSLRAGDVLGGSLFDAGYISVYDSRKNEVHGSPQDFSAAYPVESPLPGGGTAVTDHVVGRSGTYYIEVTQGTGPYQAQLEVYRYGGAARKQTQTIYLDTDGERLNTGIWGGRGVTTLSPLRAFLGKWGLARSQEKALINKIKANVQENLDADLRRSGLSKYVSVKVVTSLDGKSPWGKAGVTRIVVGGTIEESGIPTIGIAQSIDPGNYARTESGLVLLDVLSGDPAEWQDASLNFYLSKGSNRLAFVGQAVGNVTSHEVGHMIGNWHTENSNTRASLMDAGGENFALLFGVGPDGVGGTKDDRDVDFRADHFEADEGFTGTEDTLARSTWGMSTRR